MTPIMQPPQRDFPFEIMTDASDFALGAILGQKVGNKPSVIYYASRTLNDAQKNYTITEKEFLAIVCELEESMREVYDNARLAKERMKLLHDRKIKDKQLFPTQQVLLYDSRLHLFPRKLKSRWGGPYIIERVHYHDAVKIVDPKNGHSFTVNG
ncbi:uncharacterized protein LOC131151176 [Malania oleifera]|uniref:uncharacterized protein LOC131151176 n=1 Tax=Malania oleifera TaxID=397392 RepID=UPI0025ADBC0D|nr:uncharacterized protein LOC131151176 [Malania oleifera]